MKKYNFLLLALLLSNCYSESNLNENLALTGLTSIMIYPDEYIAIAGIKNFGENSSNNKNSSNCAVTNITTPGASQYTFLNNYPFPGLDLEDCNGTSTITYTTSMPTDEQIDEMLAEYNEMIQRNTLGICTEEEISNGSTWLSDLYSSIKTSNDTYLPVTYTNTFMYKSVEVHEYKNSFHYFNRTPSSSDGVNFTFVPSSYVYSEDQTSNTRSINSREGSLFMTALSFGNQYNCFSKLLNANKEIFQNIIGFEPFFGLDPAKNLTPVINYFPSILSCNVYLTGASSTPNQCETIQYPE